MEAAAEKRWSVTVSDLNSGMDLYTGLPAARYARETLLFFSFFCFRVLRSFRWGHMQCVRLEWRTDWIDCERALFTPCS